MRPTTLTWPAPAIPATSVAKISGAMTILIRRRNSWLKGRKKGAADGMVLADEPAGDDAEGEADEDLLRQGQAAARRRF